MNYAFRRFPKAGGIPDIHTIVRGALSDRAAMLTVAIS
jgi:hypothetical protein